MFADKYTITLAVPKFLMSNIIGAILVIAALMGCSEESTGMAPDELGRKFYDAIINEDFQTAASFYGGNEPVDARVQELKEQRDSLGDLKSYKLEDTIVNTIFSGKRYIFTYRLQYAHADVREMLIMFKSVRAGPLHIEVRNDKIKHQDGE